jgi:hypothetical protein
MDRIWAERVDRTFMDFELAVPPTLDKTGHRSEKAPGPARGNLSGRRA